MRNGRVREQYDGSKRRMKTSSQIRQKGNGMDGNEPEQQEATKWLCGLPPEDATDPCLAFLSNEHRFSHFLVGPFRMAQQIDGRSESPSAYTVGETQGKAVALLAEDAELIAEMVLTRSVDDFLTYISHLMKLLFSQKPEILQEIVQVKLTDILRLPDKDSVIQYAVDDYVRKLSYRSLSELYRDLKDRTSFRLFTSDASLNTAMEAVAIRNVLVHNNGIIDSRLADLVPRYRAHEGHRAADFNAVSFRNELILAVIDIDHRARNKWRLPKGATEVPHLCHRFERLRYNDDGAGELDHGVTQEQNLHGPPCERCYSLTIRCDICAGHGRAAFTFGECTECAGTGWVCRTDGRYWKREI
jgi:hypothetical protein